LLGKSVLETRVQSRASALEGDFNVLAPATQSHRAHQQWPCVINTVVLPLDKSDAECDGVKASGVVKLKSVVHKPQGGFVGGAPGDIVANQVAQQCWRTCKKTGKATGVTPGEVNTVLAAVLEVNQGALAAEF
jgi:hypothetical protein